MYDKHGAEIFGSVFSTKGNLDHDEFLDAFIDFVESRGWEFGGSSTQIIEKDWEGE